MPASSSRSNLHFIYDSIACEIADVCCEITASSVADLDLLATLSPETALRMEMAFGVGIDMLLRMQARRVSYTMRQRATEIGVKRYTPPNR